MRRLSALEARERRNLMGDTACWPVHQTLIATGEFYRGLGSAIAQSLEGIAAALHPDEVASRGLTRSTLEAITEANAGFFDSLAESSRRVSDELRHAHDRPIAPRREPVDHEQLARLVVDELRTG
jgi:hypothetical protein